MTTESPTTAREAEVFDLGYQRFEGQREGRFRARRAIWRDSIRSALGLGRSLSSKVLPFSLIALAWAYVIVIIVIAGFLAQFGDGFGDALDGFDNRGYFEAALIPLILFAAMIGPELICPDRRSNVLVLYLVRPLTPIDYIGARWAGFFTLTTMILLVPQLLIFGTLAMVATSPYDWITDHLEIIPQAIGSGLVWAAFFSSIALAVSSFTDRRPYAAGAIIALIFLISIMGEILAELIGGTAGNWLQLMDIINSAIVVNDWFFGATSEGANLAHPTYLIELLALVAVGWVVLWWRYRGVAT